jgi:hypothetical protein
MLFPQGEDVLQQTDLASLVGLVQDRLRECRTVASIEFVLVATEYARLASGTHVYDDPYLIVQLSTGVQGYAFAHPGDFASDDLRVLPGTMLNDLTFDWSPALLTGVLDACVGELFTSPQPDRLVVLEGTASVKSQLRSELIVDLLPSGTRIGVIGGIEDIVSGLAAKFDDVRVADFHLAGSRLAGFVVEADYRAVLEWCDCALITGNALKTDTLQTIVSLLTAHDVPAVCYAMTGHHIAKHYSRRAFTATIAESFPFYWFASTTSPIEVYLRSNASLNPSV